MCVKADIRALTDLEEIALYENCRADSLKLCREPWQGVLESSPYWDRGDPEKQLNNDVIQGRDIKPEF